MSDGPPRSLKMLRGWKKQAERADNRAERLEDLCRQTAGYVLANTFLDYAVRAAELGSTGDERSGRQNAI